MKLSIAVWLCTSTLACSHESRPPRAPTAAPSPTFISRLEEAPIQQSTPSSSAIPAAPSVAPPVAPPAPAETPMSMTPASGTGPARTASAQLVPSRPAPGDKAESAQDQESVREIRALLASDQALAPVAAQVVIVARNGRVWLRGQVNTAAQRAAAEKAARQAAGVINVKNELIALE
jgi:hypothetical protein